MLVHNPQCLHVRITAGISLRQSHSPASWARFTSAVAFRRCRIGFETKRFRPYQMPDIAYYACSVSGSDICVAGDNSGSRRDENSRNAVMNTLRILVAVLASLFAFAQVAPLTAFAQIAAQQQKEATVFVTNTGKRYHRAGCRYFRYSSRPMNLSDAVAAGYTPYHVCRPLFPKEVRSIEAFRAKGPVIRVELSETRFACRIERNWKARLILRVGRIAVGQLCSGSGG